MFKIIIYIRLRTPCWMQRVIRAWNRRASYINIFCRSSAKSAPASKLASSAVCHSRNKSLITGVTISPPVGIKKNVHTVPVVTRADGRLSSKINQIFAGLRINAIPENYDCPTPYVCMFVQLGPVILLQFLDSADMNGEFI